MLYMSVNTSLLPYTFFLTYLLPDLSAVSRILILILY